MFDIHPCPLPSGSLLHACQANGGYADCYRTDTAATVSHAQFVAAFYSTPVFKLERGILKWLVAKPSTDAQAQQLAAGSRDTFAAWRVEKRAPDQLLLSDFRGRTRSWLMVEPITVDGRPATRLYFGSAVVSTISRTSRTSGKPSMGLVFRALLGFHKIYSQVLLGAAKARLN